MSKITKEPEGEIDEAGGPIPPAPNDIEVFRQAAALLDGLPDEAKDRVLRALCIIFEVKP